ncbi:MAG: hypothetical protein ACP5VE_07160 [Chthonomonadales bacterium]
MSTSRQRKQPPPQGLNVPPWAAIGLVVLACIIAVVVWRLSTPKVNLPPPVKVHPGMYDFRSEAMKGNLGRPIQATPTPP